MLSPVIKPNYNILDLGSIFPLSTYWFYLNKKSKVTCADICPHKWNISDKLFLATVNLNEEKVPSCDAWNIINFQEVIEHLTCNLEKVRDNIIEALPLGGYLLAGYPVLNIIFPLGNIPLGSEVHLSDKIRPSFKATLPDGVISDHKREFFLGECESFFPLKKISTKVVFTIGYTRGTVLVLYRKTSK